MTDAPHHDFENEPVVDGEDNDNEKTESTAEEPTIVLDQNFSAAEPNMIRATSAPGRATSGEDAPTVVDGVESGEVSDPPTEDVSGIPEEPTLLVDKVPGSDQPTEFDTLERAAANSQDTMVLKVDQDSLEEFDDGVEVTEMVVDKPTSMGNLDAGFALLEDGDGDTSLDVATPISQDSEEVFVILPEQMGDDIPVVETEVFADDVAAPSPFDGDPGTDMLDGLPGELDEEAPTEEYTGYTEQPTELADEDDFAAEGPTEIVDDEELDQMATDLDDQVLDGADALGDDGVGEFDDSEAFAIDGDVAAAHGGGTKRLVATLLAAAVLGCGGFYLYNTFFAANGSSTHESGTASSAGAVAQLQPVVEDPVVEDPNTTPIEIDMDNEFRQAFRDRVTLAMNLGFEVEDSNE